MNILLPAHALAFFGPDKANNWGGVPWAKATKVASSLQGMWNGAFVTFEDGPLLFSSDCDIDTDGPGGSKNVDPDWQRGTALTTAAGKYCDSRQFPGVVVPPVFIQEYGCRKGDYGLCCLNGRIRGFQVYDVGPPKIGEVAIYLGRQLLAVRPSDSDHFAATSGNSVKDLTTLIFRKSGPGHAVDRKVISDSAQHYWQTFTGQSGADLTA